MKRTDNKTNPDNAPSIESKTIDPTTIKSETIDTTATKSKTIDTAAIEEHVLGILKALGEDPEREGLKDTPKRVAKMFEEVFEGTRYTNDEIAEMFSKTFSDDMDMKTCSSEMVIVKDIDIFSYCEHHMALMYDMKVSAAYIPNGKVIGISKIARIADMVGRRLQLQERIGTDIAEILKKVTDSNDIAVRIEGCHSCMSARGIKKTNAKTVTTLFLGRFNEDPFLQQRFIAEIGRY